MRACVCVCVCVREREIERERERGKENENCQKRIKVYWWDTSGFKKAACVTKEDNRGWKKRNTLNCSFFEFNLDKSAANILGKIFRQKETGHYFSFFLSLELKSKNSNGTKPTAKVQ